MSKQQSALEDLQTQLDQEIVNIPEEDTWPVVRRRLHNILKAPACEWSLGLVIMVNFLILIQETDISAPQGPLDDPIEESPAQWIIVSNYTLLAIYTIELTTRIYVMRLNFFKDGWCIMDFMIVGSDIVLLFLDIILDGKMPKFTVLRCFRLVRLARAFKALSMFPELNYLLRGFVSAFTAIFWGVIMVLIVLTIWSILAVQLVHPVNRRVEDMGVYKDCDRCPHAFSSVWNSLKTFTQQLVAGDSWGQISLPVIDQEPWTYFFFLAVLVTVSLAIMNLILAVIVDSGQQARADAISEKDAELQVEFEMATRLFTDLCREIDVDNSGSLTMEELHNGFDDKVEFADTMKQMGLAQADMEVIFRVFDEDESGDLKYKEFVDQMRAVRSAEDHSMLIFLKFAMQDIRLNFQKQLDTLVQRVDTVTGVEPAIVSFEPEVPAQQAAPEAAAAEPKWEPVPEQVKLLRVDTHGGAATRQQEHGPDQEELIELSKLRHVNQELVTVMRDLTRNAEAHTRILGNLEKALRGHTPRGGSSMGVPAAPLAGSGAVHSASGATPPPVAATEGSALQPQCVKTHHSNAAGRFHPGAAAQKPVCSAI